VSTGDLAPDGAIVMAYRSNVPAISQFTLRRFDPAFADRARSWGGGIIVAGHNYGQGSSREHAALAPKYLGVHAVIARSFARIHRQNLIAQGIPPFVFEADGDRGLARMGDTWELGDVRAALERGDTRLTVHIRELDRDVAVLARFSPRERQVLLAGGLIAWLRAGNVHPLDITRGYSAAADQGSPITSPLPDEPAA
jgi:aconitate hydratase